MKRLLPILMLLACGACVALGCVARDTEKGAGNNTPSAEPEPNSAPEPEVESGWQDEQGNPIPVDEVHDQMRQWLAVNPMRVKMRSMWVSCGEINSVASGALGIVDFDTLESNAENIARKAKDFGDMWETIRDANRQMATLAKKGDWFEARFQSQRVWKACTDCHVENWSLETRGFMPETIDGWIEQGSSLARVPYGDLRLTSPPEFLRMMFSMVAYLDRAVGGIDGNDSQVVLDNAQSIHEYVNEQVELWRAVERHARKIVETAAKADTLGVDRQYAKMTSNCRTCHEKYVTDDRAPLNPLPWKYRNE